MRPSLAGYFVQATWHVQNQTILAPQLARRRHRLVSTASADDQERHSSGQFCVWSSYRGTMAGFSCRSTHPDYGDLPSQIIHEWKKLDDGQIVGVIRPAWEKLSLVQ